MTYVIAEIGSNHDGDFQRAKDLICMAEDCGVNAVKFQIYEAEKLVHPSAPSLVKTHKTQLERFKSLQFTREQWEELREMTRVDFLATCFDIENLLYWGPDFKYIKIASGDITYYQLIRVAVSLGIPILLSTGASTYLDIQRAAELIPRPLLTVMHCVSNYPCEPRDANLGVIDILRSDYKVGYSDHTRGIEACKIAVAKGCSIIEKHFTDEKRAYGDHIHSATPKEMERLVCDIQNIDLMSGYLKPAEEKSLRRGAYAKRDIEKGHSISSDDVIALRPFNGKNPDKPIGFRARHNFKRLESID